MKTEIIFKRLPIILVFFIFLNDLNANAEDNSGWTFDKESKFQLGYFRTQKEEQDLQSFAKSIWINAESLHLTPDGVPDGQVPLKFSFDRGFTLPYTGNVNKLSYFLKFYKYPTGLNPFHSAAPMIKDFHLDETTEGVELSQFVKSSENVVIKAGWIRQTSEDFQLHPLPPFQLPKKSFTHGNLRTSPQDYLDSGLYYSTLYVLPKVTSQNSDLPEEEKIKQSTSGLKALRKELVNIYSKMFSVVQSPDKSNSENIFIQHYSCEGPLTNECKVTVFRVPNDILFFANARERPRPQGSKHSFGSGLLVIQRIDYSIAKSKLQNKPLSLKIIEKTWTRGQTKILELGSLVHL